MSKETKYLEVPFSVTGLSSAVPGLDMTPIKIWNTRGGKPQLLTAIDFDGTLFDTFHNWWKAVKKTALHFGASADFVEHRMLAFSAFETGRTSLTSNTKELFGIPNSTRDEEMWKTLHRFVMQEEERNPSKMFPGAIRLLNMANRIGVQPVVVTSNMIHDVPTMIARATGILDVGVVRVAGLDKSKALKFLAGYQHKIGLRHHFRVLSDRGCSVLYFGDSCSDIFSVRDCNADNPKTCVHPVYVHRSKYWRRGLPGRFDWDEHLSIVREIIPGNVRVITHGEMAEELRGYHDRT